jgi:hypothetical protein
MGVVFEPLVGNLVYVALKDKRLQLYSLDLGTKTFTKIGGDTNLSYDPGNDFNALTASPYSEYIVSGYRGLVFILKLNSAEDGYEEIYSQ